MKKYIMIVCLILLALTGCNSKRECVKTGTGLQSAEEKKEDKTEESVSESTGSAGQDSMSQETAKPESSIDTQNIPKTNSNNSSFNNTFDNSINNTNEKIGHYEERTVLVREAYDEQVVVKEGWTEQILIKEGWSEQVSECASYDRELLGYEYVCNTCGFTTTDYNAITDHVLWERHGSWHNGAELWGDSYCSVWNSYTVDHPAEYQYIYHEPEYETIHHDAEYRTERVWVDD